MALIMVGMPSFAEQRRARFICGICILSLFTPFSAKFIPSERENTTLRSYIETVGKVPKTKHSKLLLKLNQHASTYQF